MRVVRPIFLATCSHSSVLSFTLRNKAFGHWYDLHQYPVPAIMIDGCPCDKTMGRIKALAW